MLPTTRLGTPAAGFRSMLNDFFNELPFQMSNRELTPSRLWPQIDIVEKDKEYRIHADLPGVKKDDINVDVEGDVLTISGEKKHEFKEEKEKYSHFERSYGSFQRSLALPQHVSSENIDASFKDGVLEISLKKTGEPEKSKKIDIKS